MEKQQPATAPVAAISKKKKSSSAAVSATDDVLPPMETEADLLLLKKKDEPAVAASENKVTAVKHTAASGSDGDILSDGTPRKGFNTGIKKEKKKQ